MAESAPTRAVYGKALGSSLVGLAGLAAQGLMASEALAESAPIRVLSSETKHKGGYDLPLAFPENPNGVHISGTEDLDGDTFPDIVVGSPVGSDDALAVLSTHKDQTNHKDHVLRWADGHPYGMRMDVCKIPAPPAPLPTFGIISGDATGPSTHIKLSGWDRVPNSPPVVLNQYDAFPGQTMRSGVHVATGDLDGDGFMDVVVGPSGDVGQPGALPASSYIKIGSIDGEANDPPIIKFNPEFRPYGQDYRGGIRVATGDVNGDGRADLVTVGQQNGKSKIDSFTWKLSAFEALGSLVIDTPAGGDVTVAIGDVTGDGVPDLCVSKHKERKDVIDIFVWSTGSNVTAGGGPEAAGWTLFNSISVYGGNTGYDGGFNMVIQDVTGDGIGDIIAAPASVVPEPASLSLLGGAALGFRRRRRRTDQPSPEIAIKRE